ncbi:M61 family metallopeptidase [Reichenbachiella ulvae]|uniref:M61 family peptidase n=1 Tax=Reichenbachiella ulvae TaxID=2980104 RepID=A0ABT3CYS4_9BACT|nr:M61 family peptidase [Reichenbachiella ulvae]MCV9388851.1 M61 family peptidase [Reichenbachiella ulvae]
MVSCHFSVPTPTSQFLKIAITFSECQKGKVDFELPAWRPGRYELAPYADHIFRFQITDEKEKEISWVKTSPNVWSADNPKKQQLTLSYDYLANKMDAGNSFVDDMQVYINFVNCVFYTQYSLSKPHDIQLDLPIDYMIACALGHEFTLQSKDFYELADSPLIASNRLNTMNYYVGESQFHIDIMGDCPLDEKSIIKEFRRFTEEQIELMGESPTKDYRFLIQSLPYKHYHGVEHQNSTVLVLGPNTEEDKETYRENLLGVASHELFHAWNVCRIRPKEMSPYDFSKETIFETGFAAEGFTTYYGDWFLKRSGVYDEAAYFKEVNILLQRHFMNPGRHESSLIQSSRNLWVNGYKKNPPSKEVSIYVKGALASLILDIHIRKTTQFKHSLLDLMIKMYERHRYDEGGYTKEDIYRLFDEIGGKSTLELAKRLYETTEDLQPLLESAFDQVGCLLTFKNHSSNLSSATGLLLEGATILEIAPESPAYQQLIAGDKILEINGKEWSEKLDFETKEITLLVERAGRKAIAKVNIGEDTYWSTPVIENKKSPTVEQQKAKKDWLGA